MATATDTKTRKKTKKIVSEPKRYRVIFMNDEKTTMEFVVSVLMTIFRHSEVAAHELMLSIHLEGSAIVGVYSFEIAEQKGMETVALAKKQDYPLRVKIEIEG